MLNRFGAQCMKTQMVMPAASSRTYMKDLGLDSQSLAVREESGETGGEVALWKAMIDSSKNGLVLKSDDEIENYCLSLTKDYFLCTMKSSVTLDSSFADHGLDSLDVVELIIRVEDELGYVIDAENLEKFKKPRHFLNFIKHMEAYKEEFGKAPHEDLKVEMSAKTMFPGIPYLTS